MHLVKMTTKVITPALSNCKHMVFVALMTLLASSVTQALEPIERCIESATIEVFYSPVTGKGSIHAYDERCEGCSPEIIPISKNMTAIDNKGKQYSAEEFGSWKHVTADIFIALDSQEAVRIKLYK